MAAVKAAAVDTLKLPHSVANNPVADIPVDNNRTVVAVVVDTPLVAVPATVAANNLTVADNKATAAVTAVADTFKVKSNVSQVLKLFLCHNTFEL